MNSDEWFEVFSDGSSFNNGQKDPSLPMFASCGVVITYDKTVIRKGCKFFDEKTISYAELKGALLVLDLLKKRIIDCNDKISPPYNVKLYSDSQYVIKSINEWMNNWLRNLKRNNLDWRTHEWYNASGGIVGNYELFREIKLKYLDNPEWNIEFIHIKGHVNNGSFYNEMNNLCDEIATGVTKEECKKRKL